MVFEDSEGHTGKLVGAGGGRVDGVPESAPGGGTVSSDPLNGLWAEVRKVLAESLPESTFRMWLSPIEPVARQGDLLFLRAPESVSTWARRRYESLLLGALEKCDAGIRRVSFDSAAADEAGSEGPGETSVSPGPNPTHTFDRFVIGAGNHLAHNAALTVAEAPSEAYNPLFLHGPPGLGKTHLLGAIANYLAEQMPGLKVRMTSAEGFTTDFVQALKTDGVEAFKERYRNLDALLIDDVQFLAGKPRTEEEFFHTFNILHESGSQIVLSADRDPSELGELAARLSDRFEWGLTVALERPDIQTRLTVLRHLVSETGIEAGDPDAISLIASRVSSNLRQLRGALTRVVAEASISQETLTRDLVARVLPARGSVGRRPTPAVLRSLAAEHFGIAEEDLVSRKRDRRTSSARASAMLLTRDLCGSSLAEIGALYGGREHSTVASAISGIESRDGSEPETTRRLVEFRSIVERWCKDTGEVGEAVMGESQAPPSL